MLKCACAAWRINETQADLLPSLKMEIPSKPVPGFWCSIKHRFWRTTNKKVIFIKFLLSVFCFWDRDLSCSQGWPQTLDDPPVLSLSELGYRCEWPGLPWSVLKEGLRISSYSTRSSRAEVQSPGLVVPDAAENTQVNLATWFPGPNLVPGTK